MYEVRWTMYDLGNSRAVRRGEAEQMRSGIVERTAEVVRKRRGRWHLAVPMYDYDFRCTTRTTAPLRAHALAGGGGG